MKPGLLGLPAAVLFLLLGAVGCGAEGGDGKVNTEARGTAGEVRRPVIAGTWYPGDAEALTRDLDGYLAAADPPEIEGELFALVAPHAGYVYSGGVAAHAYKYLSAGDFSTVIVVAPSHRFGFRLASIYGGDGYATPLGVVPVDRELADAITDESVGLGYEPRAHSQEHSLEIQVPFLQRTLGDFQIVPIIMGEQTEGAVRVLAGRIADAVSNESDKRVLLVASTDLSHFHGQSTAVELDSHVTRAVNSFDPEGLLASLATGECEACGGGPTATVLMAARELGADRATVVDYATSGDVTGDMSQVVGYMAAVVYRAGPKPEASERSGDTESPSASEEDTASQPYEGLDESDRRALLSLARRSIEAELAGEWPPSREEASRALETACGAFVTLEKDGRLRGCIGHIQASKPLATTVMEMAVQAAFHDPRFPPLTADEVDAIDIEISVLSPLSAVSDVSEIEVGRHGLIMQDGARSGLLLPQVATDYGWDRKTFLEHTCMKAGLPTDAWKREGVTILKFTAEVFGELELGR